MLTLTSKKKVTYFWTRESVTPWPLPLISLQCEWKQHRHWKDKKMFFVLKTHKHWHGENKSSKRYSNAAISLQSCHIKVLWQRDLYSWNFQLKAVQQGNIRDHVTDSFLLIFNLHTGNSTNFSFLAKGVCWYYYQCQYKMSTCPWSQPSLEFLSLGFHGGSSMCNFG